jgi:phosphonopyruvate decarboxylase
MKTENKNNILDIFLRNNITFFSGIPDSTLKGFIGDLCSSKEVTHVRAVNECEAVSLCAGHYLSSGNVGVVYMQNSGLGKIVNPITSLLSCDSYDIPVILLIGFRGFPGTKTPHQHTHMGRITEDMLSLLGIDFFRLDDENDIDTIISNAISSKKRIAILVKKGILDYGVDIEDSNGFVLSRREVMDSALSILDENCLFLSTTGVISRELFDLKKKHNKSQLKDFYMAGSMGCIGSISLVVAKEHPDKKVIVFDGDGSLLMQMGSLVTIGSSVVNNLFHIVLDNESYDSTGGQSSLSPNVDYYALSKACGYSSCSVVSDIDAFNMAVDSIKQANGPMMIIVKIKKDKAFAARPDIGPKDIKNDFMSNFNNA